VAAIPDTGGARCAPHGMMRVLLRVVVLGGFVVGAWLLGSGTGHADDDLGVPPMVGSAVTSVLSATSLPRLTIQPPVNVGVLRPVVNADGVPKLLTPVLAPVSRPLARPGQRGAAIRSLAPAEQAVVVPSAAPAVRAAAATTSVPGPATALTAVGHASPTVPVHAAAHPVADAFAGPSALDSDPIADPVTPVPASPPGSTTSPCLIGSTAGGASTKSATDLAVNTNWATSLLAPLHRLLYLGTSDLQRSPAARPSTSPD
jgi:hypothetical protein